MVILCSSSETRAKLLRDAGIEFKQISCEFDEETIIENNPVEFVKKATDGKFMACLLCQGDDIPLISADTVIEVDNQILRKAYSEKEAINILKKQSGNVVSIITAMNIGYKNKVFKFLDKTTYKFREFEKDDLNNYIKSGEWRGKAGACMVEGFCKKYIENVTGYESTAMGLCIENIENFLKNIEN